jgi:nuclear pore complex protein Nup160
MRFELFELALELTLSLVHKVRFYSEFNSGELTKFVCRQAESRLAQDPPKTATSTWLPYTLIDQLLVATNEQTQSDLSKRAISLRRDLHREVSNGARRAQKLSHRMYQEL